jgi:hypothetical protein
VSARRAWRINRAGGVERSTTRRRFRAAPRRTRNQAGTETGREVFTRVAPSAKITRRSRVAPGSQNRIPTGAADHGRRTEDFSAARSLGDCGATCDGPKQQHRVIDFRDLTVARGRGLETPFLRLEGQWLRKAGFPVGSKVMVSVAEGRLVIEPIPARQALLFDASPNAAAPEKELTIQDPTSKPAQMTRASVPVDRRTEEQGSDSKPQSWPHTPKAAVPSRS